MPAQVADLLLQLPEIAAVTAAALAQGMTGTAAAAAAWHVWDPVAGCCLCCHLTVGGPILLSLSKKKVFKPLSKVAFVHLVHLVPYLLCAILVDSHAD